MCDLKKVSYDVRITLLVPVEEPAPDPVDVSATIKEALEEWDDHEVVDIDAEQV